MESRPLVAPGRLSRQGGSGNLVATKEVRFSPHVQIGREETIAARSSKLRQTQIPIIRIIVNN